MTKNFKIEVDCANCANLVENAIQKLDGIDNAVISFMTQKMKITFAEGANVETVMEQVLKTARKIEPDFAIL